MESFSEGQRVVFVRPLSIQRSIGGIGLASIFITPGVRGNVIVIAAPGTKENQSDSLAVFIRLDNPLPDSTYGVWVKEQDFNSISVEFHPDFQ